MRGVNGPHFNLIAFLVIKIAKVINFFNFFIYLEVSLYQYNESRAAAEKVEKNLFINAFHF